MKPILLFLILFSFAFTGKRDIRPLLCGKTWYMAYVRVGDSVVKVPEEIPLHERPSAYFHMDGKFENNMNGKKKQGAWRYDETRKELTTVEESRLVAVMKLVYLTKDSLELITPDKMIMGLIHEKN